MRAFRRVSFAAVIASCAVLFTVAGDAGASGGEIVPAALGDPSTFVPLPPTRIVDTRDATGGIQGPIASDATVDFQARGVGNVPNAATSVVLNVTAVDPQGGGYFTIYPSGTPRPGSSSLNVVPGRNVANLVIARIGDNGKVSLYNFGGGSQVIFDVTGYFVPGTGAGRFYGSAPTRVLDTRSMPRTNGVIAPIGPGQIAPLVIRSQLPSESHWAAVMINVTATNAAAGGYLTIYPTGDPFPLASSLNFVAGQTVANAVIVKLGPSGANSGINIFNAFGTTDVIVDLVGVFDDGNLAAGFTVPTAFRALDQPTRVHDTRTTGTPFGHETRVINVAGAGGAPAGALGVAMNATVTNTNATSYLSIWPSLVPQPTVSSLNWGPGDTVPNFVGVFIAGGGANAGNLSVYNDAGKADVIFDVTGYFYAA